jgi:hypothetical protein
MTAPNTGHQADSCAAAYAQTRLAVGAALVDPAGFATF